MKLRESLIATLVILLITGGCRTSGTSGYPFNRVGKQDEMGLIKNPVWQAVDAGESPCRVDPINCSRRHPGEGCTSKFLNVDHSAKRPWYEWLMPWKWGRASCVVSNPALPGHLNLENATIEGFLGYEGIAFDGDYDLTFQPRKHEGLTANNQINLMLEFSSRETFNQFEQLPPWWNEFTDLTMSSHKPDPVNALLARDTMDHQPPYAITTGVLGLDCVHGCKTEVHPVYVLAIRTGNTPTSEQWQLFVRNWGTEGWCGRMMHTLGLDEIKVLLPNPKAADGGSIKGTFRAYNAVKPVARNFLRFLTRPKKKLESIAAFQSATLTEEGYVLAFRLDPATERSAVVGEVTIQWNTPKQAVETPPPVACPMPTKPKPLTTPDDPETIAEKLLKQLPPEEQVAAIRQIAIPEKKAEAPRIMELPLKVYGPDDVAAPLEAAVSETITVSAGASQKSEEEEAPRSTIDRGKQGEIERVLSIVCKQTGAAANTPEYRRLCGRR
jgi:hypothetical protein